MFKYFAESEGPHVAIAPEKLFEIGSYTITNSMFYGWICAVVIISLLVVARKRITVAGSNGLSQLIDAGADFMISMLAGSLGSRERAVRYAPIFATFFFFILFNNWLGLLPGVGPAVEYNGSPLLRPFTADLNATLAMAAVGIFFVEFLAIRQNGVVGHINHLFPGKWWNPLTYFIGVFEIFTELTRLFSLGLRLFLNVVIGEILIAIFAYLGGVVAPLTALPFMLLEIFVAVLQAYIFVLLCASYLSVATSHSQDHVEESA